MILDNRHGAAITYSQLRILLTQTSREDEAILFSLEALQARLETTREWSRLDLAWLKRQQRAVGDKRLREIVTVHSGQEFLASLLPLLEQIEEAEHEPFQGPTT